MKKTIGIIGGMGPLATADLFRKIILHTEARSDQAHLRVLIDNNTNIPDRTAALLHGGADPAPEMIRSARWLEQGGADLLIMPCNTAHNFRAQVQAAVSVPVLDMIQLTCDALKAQGVVCAGLLATTGTIQTGIYQRVCGASGIRLLTPDGEGQTAVMEMIYSGVKAGLETYDTSAVLQAVAQMQTDGAQKIVLGCTELPLAAEQYGLRFPSMDPTLELALAAIRAAGATVRPQN